MTLYLRRLKFFYILAKIGSQVKLLNIDILLWISINCSKLNQQKPLQIHQKIPHSEMYADCVFDDKKRR